MVCLVTFHCLFLANWHSPQYSTVGNLPNTVSVPGEAGTSAALWELQLTKGSPIFPLSTASAFQATIKSSGTTGKAPFSAGRRPCLTNPSRNESSPPGYVLEPGRKFLPYTASTGTQRAESKMVCNHVFEMCTQNHLGVSSHPFRSSFSPTI